jgi:hypothetical protein
MPSEFGIWSRVIKLPGASERSEIMIFYWVSLAFLAVVVNVSDIVMKLRVNGTLQERERFSWWNHGARAVSRKYRDLFPGSYLPDVERYSFWLFVGMLLMWAVGDVWKRN